MRKIEPQLSTRKWKTEKNKKETHTHTQTAEHWALEYDEGITF